MADILLGTLRDYWKGVYDWVTGASASRPEVAAPDLETLIGEVSATPTENTVLERLKALEDVLTAEDFASQTTLAAILAKIIAAPATEATLVSLAAEDFATQTTLAAILAKIIAAPATEAKQDTLIAKDYSTETTLGLIKDTDGIKKITDTVDINEAGSNAEIASSKDTQVATTVQPYVATGASQMEIYVESGSIRVRTDGNPASAATGEPIGNDFYGSWAVSGVSVYYVEASTITVVSR